MKKFLESPLGKGVLEAGRWALLAFVSTFVTRALDLVPGLELDPALAFKLTAFLRFADLLLHKSGVAEKGLVRF